MMDQERYSRNIALFGAAGQQRIATSKVAIIGLGGLGSQVAQQLSYLGVSEFVYVDPDVVTRSSLNRLVGATPADAKSATHKVSVAQRLTEQVLSTPTVHAIPERLDSPAAAAAIRGCTSVMACLDNDSARLDLIELCCRSRIPYFDLATDTGEHHDAAWYGGRILFSSNGARCPSCMDLLDQEALAVASMTSEQQAMDERIYGVRRRDLDGTGPSVVSLNGVIASLAVMEWMVWTTGLREPVPMLEYRGQMGAVFVSNDQPSLGCYYCSLWRREAS